jgi:hypothetical protein
MASWPGLMTNADPHDLPAGAAVVQINCYARRPGELSVRRGHRIVEFDDPGNGSVVDSQIISLAAVGQPQADYIVFLNTLGQVRIAKNPQ